MTLLLLALFALPVPHATAHSAPGDTVRVALAPTADPGPFTFETSRTGAGVRFPDVAEEAVVDLPAGFAPIDTFHVDLQDEVALLASVRNGFTEEDRARATLARWGAADGAWDALHTARPDQAMLVVTGHDAAGRTVALVDTDNDEQLSDETAIVFPDVATSAEAEAAVAALAPVVVAYERVDPETGAVATARAAVRINPFPTPERWPARPGASVALRVTPVQYLAGGLAVEGETFRVAAASTAEMGTTFFPALTGLVFGRGTLDPPSGPEPAYRVGDDVVLGASAYRIAALSTDGASLTLVRVGAADAAVAPRPGHRAPPVAGRATDGRDVDLAAMRGAYVVLDFWGTWCTPCLAALPEMKVLEGTARAAGVAFIGVAEDEEPSADAFVRTHGVGWPQLAGASARAVAARYGITRYPTLVVIAPDGRVAMRAAGASASPDEVRAMLAEAMPEAGF